MLRRPFVILIMVLALMSGSFSSTQAVGSKRVDIFSLGPDGQIWQKWWSGSSWNGWTALGKPSVGAASSPTAAWNNANSVHIFVRGGDNAIWTKSWNGSSWGSWWSLGGSSVGGPDAAVRSDGRIDLFVRGEDNVIWTRAWDGSSWGSGWWSLGGSVTSDPTAVWNSTSSLAVFARGTDNAIWTKSWNGSSWGSWWSLGGSFASGPDAAVRRSDGRIDLFALGGDNAIWTRAWDGSSWGGWWSLGGYLVSDPGATWSDSSHLDVFARGPDNQVWQMAWNGSSWNGWTALGGPLAGAPDAATPLGSSPPASGYALPIPKSTLPRSEYDDPHHDYPAIDLPTPTGTPAYALRSGTVSYVGSGCGYGILITADDGAAYKYCHLNSRSVASGSRVTTGQLIGYTGNTGDSTGPHLHLEVNYGGLRCPQNMLLAIYDGTTVPHPSSLPTSGCSY